MTTRFPALLLALLAACTPRAASAVEPRGATRALQPSVQQQADLVVRCVAQRTLPRGLTAPQRAVLARVAADLRAGHDDVAKKRWSEFISEMAANGGAVDPNALIQWVLREAYLEQVQDLRTFADKVRFFNEAKESIRVHLAVAKALKARGAPRSSVPVQQIQVRTYTKNAQPVVPAAKRQMTKGEIEDYISGMEKKLNSVGDDAQLANTDLQNILQKQQQTMQMLSNIMKMMSETANGITRNLK